MLDSAEWLLV
ncbi:hypothetical protein LINPERHAP2_LOCUS33470 [Linum perenne]